MFAQLRPAPPRSSICAAYNRAGLLSCLGVCECSGPKITKRASGSSTTSLMLEGHACTFAKSPRCFS